MFAARFRASLQPLFHGRHISYLNRNCDFASIQRLNLLNRFNDGNRGWIKLLYGSFHCSSPCYTSESDVGVKTKTAALFSSLNDDVFSELGSVEKTDNQNMVPKLLTTMLEPPQITKAAKKMKKKKKHEQASDSTCKPKLLTEKPEVFWKINGQKKKEAHASSPAVDDTESAVSFSKLSDSLSLTLDHKSKAQNTSSPCLKVDNKTDSRGSNNHSSLAVIRISNLNSETTDSMIHSMCLLIRPIEGLVRVNEHSVDVLFRARNLNEVDYILDELNDTTVDHSKWTAKIVQEEAYRDQMGLRINSCFEDLEKQMTMRRILAKDLEVLLHSIMHLENHPNPMAHDGT
ncbi:unnamed protein product [Cochlearia groenlandica]